MIHLELVNGKLVQQGYEKLGGSVLKVGRLRIYKTAQAIFRRLGIYARKIAKQAYVRTYTSRQAREIQKTDKGYIVVYNPTNKKGRGYGVYLRGSPGDESTQAAIHQGRWVPFAVINEQELNKLPAEVVADLKKVADEVAQEMRDVK